MNNESFLEKTKKKAVFVIAHQNFRDEELFEPKRILETAGIEVTLASTEKGMARGMLGATVDVGATLDELNVQDFDAVIFVGGSGALELARDLRVVDVARQAYDSGKIVAAICVAPMTLSNAGLLKEKKVCAFESVANDIRKAGALNVSSSGVLRDNNIITASGPDFASSFGKTILQALQGD